MTKIGYARVSSTDQDTAIQVEALKAAGCTVIREEKVSGSSLKGRTELATILDFLRPGDVLIATRVDRIARSVADLQTIVRSVREKGATLECTEQPIDTSSPTGKAFLDMLGVFAEFETNIRRERQLDGIARKKAMGGYKGRKPSIDAAEIIRLRGEGLGASAIANQLKIARSSVYRILEAD